MSDLLANASPVKPEIRLAQAISQLEADLSSEQKATFYTYRSQSRDSPPNPSDVMQLTAEIDRRASGKIGGRCFGPRLTFFPTSRSAIRCARGYHNRRLAKPNRLWYLVDSPNIIARSYLLTS